MSTAVSDGLPDYQSSLAKRDLLLILFLALLVRAVLFNGAFGSDDVVYFRRAAALAMGDWTSSSYNGALRYGFNLPAAGFLALFGESLFVANLWPLTCSLVEIGAVYLFACAAMNRRAGVLAALLLAAAPLHISVATRVHADPVVSMFITLGFVLLYFGALRRSPFLLVAAGLSIGSIFWAKELAAVTWFAFLPMLWFFRERWRDVSFVVAGAVLMMLLHGALMWYIAGDPLHLVKVVLGAVKKNFVDGGDGEDGATYYLRYLFIDMRHTGLLGIFATASILLVPRWMKEKGHASSGFSFVLIWWIGLIAVLSLFPVSLAPLRLTMKQSNYMTLFLGPTAVLAGMAIVTLPRIVGRLALALCLALGLLLGALQQADYRAFGANSKALAAFALEHPQSVIVGSTNSSSLGGFLTELARPDGPRAAIVSFRDLSQHEEDYRQRQLDADAIYAVLDRQTMSWGAGHAPVTTTLPCWEHELTLQPVGLGFGNELARLASGVFARVKPLASLLDHLAHPQRADVYRVKGSDALCRER